MKKFIVLVILLMFAVNVFGADWYVDDDAAPGGDGTSADLSGGNHAWDFMDDAINAVEDSTIGQGDTVNVAAGIYPHPADPSVAAVKYTEAGDAGRTGYINFVGDSGAYPIVKGGNLTNTTNAYLSFQYFHFDQLDSTIWNDDAFAIYKAGANVLSYIKFNDCEFHQDDQTAYRGGCVRLKNVENIDFTDCTFIDGDDGIELLGDTTDVTLTTCTFQDQWGDALSIFPGLLATGFEANIITIDGCTFTGMEAIYGVTTASYHMDMLDLGGVINDLIIRNCIVVGSYNGAWQGWTGLGPDGNEYGVHLDGLFHYSIQSDQGEGANFLYENNLMYGTFNQPPRFDGSRSSRTGLIVRNNTHAGDVIYEGLSVRGYIETGEVVSTALHYNNIWGFNSTQIDWETVDANTDQNNNIYDNYDDVNSNTAIGANSSEISVAALKALFTDEGNNIYTIIPSSIADGGGDNTKKSATDINDDAWENPPNIGCYTGSVEAITTGWSWSNWWPWW